ncbi:MAG: DUF305 domain-containing protein [Acidimicrobiales bacterium]
MRPRHALPALALSVAVIAGACSSGNHDGMNMNANGNMSGSSMPHDAMGSGPMGSGGSGGSTSTISVPADAEFNATDVAFAQGMIPHHGQAVQMADMALDISTNPTIRALAEKIKAAQDPEIATMEGWLKTWGQPVPDRNQPMDHASDGMGGMMMSGMMSEADMARMGNASGTDFDRMFLEMMVRHHEGAIQMAEQQLAAGKYQPTKDLAQVIITAQKAEIDEMNALLATTG